MDYIGLKCPVCGKTFTADDDIVVCPECGAPYHRSCYQSVGKCIFADQHGTGKAWVPPERNVRPEGGGEPGTRRCPRCGAENPASAMFCAHCGLPLSFDDDQIRGGNPPFPNGAPPYSRGGQPNGYPPSNAYPPQGGPVWGQMPFPIDPMGGVNPNDTIGGIPAGDVAKFIQSNTQYYMPIFMNLKHLGKNQFNFSAFLFPGLWMLYRKIYKIGAILTSVLSFLACCYLLISQFYSYPIYVKLLTTVGINTDTLSMTMAQERALYAQFYLLPAQQKLLLLLPSAIIVAKLILRFIVGFSGNKMYLNHCVKKIGSIHRTDSANLPARLEQEGGVNMALAAGLGVCLVTLLLLVTQL